MKRERMLAYIAFAIVCTVWGTTYLGIAVAIETLPTFLFPGLRFTIAGAVLLLISLARGEKLPRSKSDWLNLTLIGIMMVTVGNIAVVYAEHAMSSGFAALLVATAPFWMAALELFRREGERLDSRKIWGMIIGFTGVGFLVAPELGGSEFNVRFLLGVLALQLGSICWNFGSIRSKYHLSRDIPPLTSASLQMLTGGIVTGAIGLGLGEADRFVFTTRTFIAFAYLVIFGSIIAYAAYVYALSKLSTSTTSLYAYINPVVAVVLGGLILNERIGWNAIVGMTIIFGGVALVQMSRKPVPVVSAAEGTEVLDQSAA